MAVHAVGLLVLVMLHQRASTKLRKRPGAAINREGESKAGKEAHHRWDLPHSGLEGRETSARRYDLFFTIVVRGVPTQAI